MSFEKAIQNMTALSPFKHPIRKFLGTEDQKKTVVAPAPTPNETKTAAPVDQLSEIAKKNRKRNAAFQPRSFAPPTLGQTGLLG